MEPIQENLLENSPDGVRNSPEGSDNGSNSPGKRRRSLPSGAESFVMVSDGSVVDEGGEQSVLNQLRDFQHLQLKSELESLSALVHGVMGSQCQFQSEAKLLVTQVAESLATLDNSRVQQEKVTRHQQSQMENLMNQTQEVIQRCQETSQEMKKQQWGLNSQFADLNKWKKDVEQEFVQERMDQRLLSERVNVSQNEAHGNLSQLRQELLEMRQKNRQRTEPIRSFDHGSMNHVSGGAKTEVPPVLVTTSFCESDKRLIILNHPLPPKKNTLPPEKDTLPRS